MRTAQKKEQNMRLATPLIALSVLTIAFATPAFGQLKGGEKLAGVRASTSATPPSKMTCPTETRKAVDHAGGRGAFKKVSVHTAHLCPTCKTKEVTKGVVKLAVRKVEHSCQTMTVCCNVKK